MNSLIKRDLRRMLNSTNSLRDSDVMMYSQTWPASVAAGGSAFKQSTHGINESNWMNVWFF